jgi:hypothetical protein
LDKFSPAQRRLRSEALRLLSVTFSAAAATHAQAAMRTPGEQPSAADRMERAAQAAAVASNFGADVDVDDLHAATAAAAAGTEAEEMEA